MENILSIAALITLSIFLQKYYYKIPILKEISKIPSKIIWKSLIIGVGIVLLLVIISLLINPA